MNEVTEIYLFLLLAFAGLCLLFLAGYLRFRGKSAIILYLIGASVIGVAFINISAIEALHINPFVILIWVVIHLFVSWLIVEGSTRIFIIQQGKKMKRENEITRDPRDFGDLV